MGEYFVTVKRRIRVSANSIEQAVLEAGVEMESGVKIGREDVVAVEEVHNCMNYIKVVDEGRCNDLVSCMKCGRMWTMPAAPPQ